MKKLTILTCILSFPLFSWTNDGDLQPAYRKLKKALGYDWALIPSGDAKLGESIQHVAEFYILKTEVSNGDYLTFLAFLKDKHPEQYKSALPDTSVWKDLSMKYNYTNHYLRHLSFKNYPVVGIKYENALLYCKWLEDNINSKLEGDKKVVVKLPSELEWIRAARGSNHSQIFTWESINLQDKKGNPLANYRRETRKIEPAYDGIITIGVKTFDKNQFGVYQMIGNVAEMLDERSRVKGGSWNSPAQSLQVDKSENIDSPSNAVGFRPILVMVSN